MSEKKHSPTPWKVSRLNIVTDEGVIVGRVVASAGLEEVNAAHIVKCVNAHDELVAALKDLADRFAYAAADDEDDAAALDRASAALKKAGAL